MRANRSAFVTGAAGVLGSRLVSGLLEAGWKVRGLVLPGDPARARLERLGCEVWEGDVCDPTSLRGCCAGIDLVYHLAAIIISHDPSAFRRVNLDGTAHVIAEAAGSAEHFVYVSSASVTYPKRTPYAESKLQAERRVAGCDAFRHTIVRPTLVYDRQGGQELEMFLDYLRRFPVVPFIGAGGALKRPVRSDDIVAGLLALAGREIAYGKTYNFSGAESISMLEFARLLLRHRDRPKPFVHLSVPLCVAAARVLGACMERPPLTLNAIAGVIHDADLDPTEAMRDLDYKPIGVRAGIAGYFPISQADSADPSNPELGAP